jgi:hypothetical protein
MKAKNKLAKSTDRCIHLIDIENICGSSNPSVEQVVHARKAYLSLVEPGIADQFFVRVSSRTNLEAASFGWPNARVHCKEGHDGADILIAKDLIENDYECKFKTIYLASGDGGLAPFAKHVVSRGGNLAVISLPQALSMKMRFTGAKVLYLNAEKGMVP